MGNSAFSAWRRQSASWALLAVLAGCGSVATDGLPPGTAALAVVPEYPANFDAATLNLVIDRVRVRVVRPPSEWIVDTSAVFPVDAKSITMRLSLPLKARQEQLGVVLELWAGPLMLFSGARTVEVTEGQPLGEPPRILLTYRGPGAEARTIRITPRDTVLRPGQDLQFRTEADNGAGFPVGDVYVNWSVGGTGATVTPAGVLTAPGQRGSVLLRAAAATGARDSTRIWFAPAPTLITPVSGAGQSGLVGSAAARTVGGEGTGRRWPGGPRDPGPVLLCGGGRRRGLEFGHHRCGRRCPHPGPTRHCRRRRKDSWRFVAGLGAAQFGVTATVGPASSILIVRGHDQVAAPGTQVPVPLEISVRDQFGNTVRNALVRWTIVQGGGELGLTETLTDGSGVALSAYRMGPAAGTNVVRATLDATDNSVLFLLRTP